jgi:sn-glycerol 3-phosphate transport system substrate-binding protein
MRRRRFLGALTSGLSSSLIGCRRSEPAPGSIRLWFTYGGNNRKVLLGLVERYMKEHPNRRVEATYQGDYFEGLVKLRTGLFVDAVPTVTHVVGEVIPYLAAAGALQSIDDVGRDTLDQLVPALSQKGTFEGGDDQPTFALPFNRSTPIAYCNATLFDELGLSPPRTWDELRKVAAKAVRRGGETTERWGFECPIDWWFWVGLVGQAGGRLVEPSGDVSLGGPAGAAAVRLWQRMIHEDRTMKPPPGRDYNAWEATNNDFLAGRVAMIWTSTAFLRYLEDNAKFRVVTAPLPKRERFAVPTGGTFFVMPKGIDGSERDAGLHFLRWMMQPRQANEWATKTGYMPVNQRGYENLKAEGFYDDHPNDRVTLEQLDHAMAWPWAPELFRVQREAVQPRLESAVLEQLDPQRMIARAVESLEGV